MLAIEPAMPETIAPMNTSFNMAVGTEDSHLYTVGDAKNPRKPMLKPTAENIESAANLPIASTFLCESR